MDKILISIDDLVRYRPTSKSIPLDRIQPYIRETQQQDLLPLLGDTLYYDFLTNFDNSSSPMYQSYQYLLYGRVYTPAGLSSNISYEGIIPMISYYTLARYYENSQVNATSYGLVQKSNEYSTSVSAQVVQASTDYLRSLGLSYQHEVKRFLSNYSTTYTLYSTGVKGLTQDIGVKFFSI